jgi:hypothetical protein
LNQLLIHPKLQQGLGRPSHEEEPFQRFPIFKA